MFVSILPTMPYFGVNSGCHQVVSLATVYVLEKFPTVSTPYFFTVHLIQQEEYILLLFGHCCFIVINMLLTAQGTRQYQSWVLWKPSCITFVCVTCILCSKALPSSSSKATNIFKLVDRAEKDIQLCQSNL